MIPDYDKKYNTVEFHEHVPETTVAPRTSALGYLANEEDHEVGKLASFRKYPWACAWSIYMVWVVLLVSFENQAAGNVIGIPEFRKDFGHQFTSEDGSVSYVVDAQWQSAFQGAPVASYVTPLYGRVLQD
jgi:hypothetical protein